MLIALPFTILIAATVAMLVIHIVQPKFAYHWLVAAGGALLAWLVALILHSFLPLGLALPAWLPLTVYPESPTLLLDEISWSFTFALSTLLLSAILTAVARSSDTESSRSTWVGLVGSIVLTAVSLLTAAVGNLLALQLSWTVLDLLELGLGLTHKTSPASARHAILLFASRIASQFLLLFGIITAQAGGLSTSLIQLDSQITPFVFLAAGIRLGVLPLVPNKRETDGFPVSLHTVSNLAPLASTLMLICRAAATSNPPTAANLLLLLFGLAGLYGSFSWYILAREFPSDIGWITGIGALVLASGLRLQPTASLAWGIALIFGGGLLFLSRSKLPALMPVLLAGVFFLSTFPGSPSWFAVRLYAAPFQLILILYLISHGFLLAGSLRYAWQTNRVLVEFERWVWALYTWGLVLLLLGWLLVFWWAQLFRVSPGLPRPSLVESWPALASIVLAALFFWIQVWRWPIFLRISDGLRLFFSLVWLYRLAGYGFVLIRRVLFLGSTLLESQAGILWAFLLLVLLLSLFSQVGQGG